MNRKSKRKILTFLMCCFSMMSFAQQVTFNVSNVTVKDAVIQFKKATGYSFVFGSSKIDTQKIITVNANNQPLKNVVDQILVGQDMNYDIDGKFIIIKERQFSKQKNIVNPQKNALRSKVSGKVVDERGEPIIGATVSQKGSSNGTITDVNGNYLLEIPMNSQIEISYIGYQKKVVVPGMDKKVILKEESKALNEVVVVGYGTQRKADLTGAVSSVQFSNVAESRSITTVSNALAGLSSGVTVRQGSGLPGSDGATIRIRGIGTLNDSSPLVLVDGMEGSMDNLNPQDIESISILKDAAASSIYGSRAANGVILVTTKSGSGKKISITYSGMFSVNKPTHIVNFVTDYPDYMRLMNESATNIGQTAIFQQSTIDAWIAAQKDPNATNSLGVPNYVSFPNTDWNKEMYQSNMIQEHSVSINGSGSKAKYLLSAGYLDNPGLVENTYLRRYNFRTNVEIDVTKWLKAGTRTYGNLDSNGMGNFSGMLTYLYATTPGVYPKWNGVYGFKEAPEESATANNLYKFLDSSLGYKRTTRFNTTLYAIVNPLKGLTYNFNINYNKYLYENNNHTNPLAHYLVQFSTGAIGSTATTPDNCSTNYYMESSYQYTLEHLIKYKFSLSDLHHFDTLLGYNQTYYKYNYTSSTKKGLPDPDTYDFDAASTMVSMSGNSTDYAMRSVFGRMNYDYDNRYLFEANLRYDGSSRFSSENHRRWGVFPSFSAGWRITEESFMRSQRVFDNLKIRLSWGKLGNSVTPSSNYDYMALYNTVNYSFGSSAVTGLAVTKYPNEYLKWETTNMFDIGFDASFFNNRLSTEFDFYSRQTDGILSTPPAIITAGMATAPSLNLASVSNRGLEFTARWSDNIGQLHYMINGNVSVNRNRVTKYKGTLEEGWDESRTTYSSNLGQVSTGDYYRTIEGHQINEYYVYRVYHGNATYFNPDGSVNKNGGPHDGMIRTTQDMNWLRAMMAAGYTFGPYFGSSPNKSTLYYGDYIYSDLNGDGKYGNSYDRSFTHKSYMPTIVFGFETSFSWKGFDMDLLWSGQGGNQIYWCQRGYNSSLTASGYQIGSLVANDHYYYNESDPSDASNNIQGKYPRLKENVSDTQNTLASDRWLYNGFFIRLKSASLGYTFPFTISNKVFAQKIRVFISSENLFTITSFPGQDPEMITASNGNANYPLLRQFTFGANITF